MNQASIPFHCKEESMTLFNNTKNEIIECDRRFSEQDGHLLFEDVDLYNLCKKIPTPFYVYSEKEIIRNIEEIKDAFKAYPNTKVFYASKACSVMGILKVVKEAGVHVETNSLYEIMKCIEIGFKGEEIVFNGVLKKRDELEYAIQNNVYSINVDSFYELSIIEDITNKLKKTANVSVRIEPNVPSPVHPGSITAYHSKAGIDLKDAESMCRKILAMPYVKLKGIHMHVGDQVPAAEPFAKATKVMVQEAARLEKVLGIRFELLNVGGGIPVPYKYEKGDALKDYMYGGISCHDFADAIITEVCKWRSDIEICIEPGRKVVSSAGVLLSSISCEKTKTNFDEDYNVLDIVNWKFVDAGYSVLSDSLHFDWFFYVLNAANVKDEYSDWCKIAGPLCDGGDYFHQGTHGEFYLMPKGTAVGDVLAIIDAGAYSIESQTTYNSRPRTAVAMIAADGQVKLIRRGDAFSDIIGCDIY